MGRRSFRQEVTAQTWTAKSGGKQESIREAGGLSNVEHGVSRGRV